MFVFCIPINRRRNAVRKVPVVRNAVRAKFADHPVGVFAPLNPVHLGAAIVIDVFPSLNRITTCAVQEETPAVPARPAKRA